MLQQGEKSVVMMQRLELMQTWSGRLIYRMAGTGRHVFWRWWISKEAVIKRGLDLIGAVLLMIGLAPILLITMLLIKLEDGGPILFIQTRIGKRGKQFPFLKFRSMIVDAEDRLKDLLAENEHKDGVTFKIKGDPRITRVGRWLRKLSIDELPQLINVLRGEMSLVGPRPPVPREVRDYTKEDMRRLTVKPGLTCLWQIKGRADIDFKDQVALDVRYIEEQTAWQDLKILVKTVPAVLNGKGAY